MSRLIRSKEEFYRFVTIYIVTFGILYVMISKGRTEILYSLVSLVISFIALNFIIDVDSFFHNESDSFSKKRSEFLVMGEEQVGNERRSSREQRYLNYVEKSFTWVKKIASLSVFITPFFFSDIGLGFRSLVTLTSLCIINTSYINQFKIPVLLYLIYYSLTQKVDSLFGLIIIISIVFFLMLYLKSFHENKSNGLRNSIYLSCKEVLKYFLIFFSIMFVVSKFDLNHDLNSKLMKKAIESARFEGLSKNTTKLDSLIKDQQNKIKKLERKIKNQRIKRSKTLSDEELSDMLSKVDGLAKELNSIENIDVSQSNGDGNSDQTEALSRTFEISESQKDDFNNYIRDVENHNIKVEKLNSLQNKIEKVSKGIAKELSNTDSTRDNNSNVVNENQSEKMNESDTSRNQLESYKGSIQDKLSKEDILKSINKNKLNEQLNGKQNDKQKDKHDQITKAQKIDPQNELKTEVKKHKNKLGKLSKFIEFIFDWIYVPIIVFVIFALMRFFKSHKISKTIDHDKVLSAEIKYKLKHIFAGPFDNHSMAVEVSFRRFCHCLDEIYFSGQKSPPPGILVKKLFNSNKRINIKLQDSVEVFNSYMYMNSEITNKSWKKYRKSLQIVINYIIKSGNLI